MKKDPLIFLKHIFECVNKIEEYLKGISKEEFLKNTQLQDAIIRRIEVMGEAIKNLPIEFVTKYPSFPWSDIAKTRDKFIHQYFGIDLERVWKTVKENIPELKKKIIEIIESEEGK